jgi:hypothetical protein
MRRRHLVSCFASWSSDRVSTIVRVGTDWERTSDVARSEQTKRANDLLAPVYGWFSEGFDTSDFKEEEVLKQLKP